MDVGHVATQRWCLTAGSHRLISSHLSSSFAPPLAHILITVTKHCEATSIMSYSQLNSDCRVFLVERSYFPDDFAGLVKRATETTEDCRRAGRVEKKGRLTFFPSSENYTELVEYLTSHHLQHVS